MASSSTLIRLERPIHALPKNTTRKWGDVGLGLTSSYNRHWSIHQAVDEYVQNWVDQLEKCGKENSSVWRGSEQEITWFFTDGGDSNVEAWIAALVSRGAHVAPGVKNKGMTAIILGVLAFDAFAETLQCVNYAATLESKCFLLGYSGDDKGGETRGKFGDGLPSSTVKLISSGISIDFFTGRQRYCGFAFKTDPSFGHECLHMHITGVGDAWEEGRCLARQVSTKAILGRPRSRSGQNSLAHGFPVPDPDKDTIIILRGITQEHFDIKRYVFLHPELRASREDHISDGYADLFLDESEIFKGTVFVKDMLAMVSKGSRAPHFGYNLKRYSVKSRDRQESIPQDDLGKQLALIWSKVLKSREDDTRKLARRSLYDAMSTNPECAEAGAVCDDWGSPMDHVCSELASEFLERNGPDSFPFSRADTEAQQIISDKLKKTPVEVNDKIFRCLTACKSAGFHCSAKQVWHQTRLEAVKGSRATVPDGEPFDSLVSVITQSFKKMLDSSFPSVRLVEAVSLDEVAVLECCKPAAYRLTGFANAGQDKLEGVYTEDLSSGTVNGKPVFKGQNGYLIVWTDGGWILSFVADLSALRRETNHSRIASCPESSWWTKKACCWTVWSGQSWGSCVVQNVPQGSSKDDRVRNSILHLNTAALKQHLHSPSTQRGKEKCRHPSTCLCAFSPLFETVLADLRNVAKVQITDLDEREARDVFMHAMLALDRTTLQKSIDRLHGVDSRSRAARNLTEWLRMAMPDEAETADSDEPCGDDEKRVRQLIKEQVDLGMLRLNPDHDSSLAWVGDAVLDAYLGVIGADAGLRPRELDRLRQALFCTKRMGCDAKGGWKHTREASERREKDVGDIVMKRKTQLMRQLGDILDRAMLPQQNPPYREVPFGQEIRDAVQAKTAEESDNWASSWKPQSQHWGVKEVCWYFENGGCRWGPTCDKVHPCKFFRHGQCTKGDRCTYYHGELRSDVQGPHVKPRSSTWDSWSDARRTPSQPKNSTSDTWADRQWPLAQSWSSSWDPRPDVQWPPQAD